MTTSRRIARKAGSELRAKGSTKSERQVAGSALSQARRTTKRTTRRKTR